MRSLRRGTSQGNAFRLDTLTSSVSKSTAIAPTEHTLDYEPRARMLRFYHVVWSTRDLLAPWRHIGGFAYDYASVLESCGRECRGMSSRSGLSNKPIFITLCFIFNA